MAFTTDWLERCDWSRRAPEFGALSAHGDFAAIDFARPETSPVSVSDRLWELWLTVPAQPNILAAVDRSALRYAAIDWLHQPVDLDDPEAAVRCATWGSVLARAYEHLQRHAKAAHLAWFACPLIEFDLEGGMRIAFVSADKNEAWRNRLPPEIFEHWPSCDERGLVFVIGHALLARCRPSKSATPMGLVLQRCIERDPGRRFASLGELTAALRTAGARPVPRAEFRSPRHAWDLVETGIGWLAVGDAAKALVCFADALHVDPKFRPALLCRDEAMRRGVAPITAAVSGDLAAAQPANASATAPVAARLPPWPASPFSARVTVSPRRPWAEVEAVALERERVRDFGGALAMYQHVIWDGADVYSLELGTARCQVHLGLFGEAIAHAKLALQESPESVDARALLVTALLREHHHAEALGVAEEWIARQRTDARAYHARGKCLLGLGRLVEAREAFVRAGELNPQLLEAMLLRRELDRSVGGLRATVGTANEITIDIPAHLAELRDVLVGGPTADAIRVLRQPEYERDTVAQLLLAGLLSFDGRHVEAIEVCDVVVRLDVARLHDALLAKADSLVEIDRAAEALVVYERIRAERPELVDAISGRARALLRLGRGDEADAALAEYLAITGRRSDLRVRASRFGA